MRLLGQCVVDYVPTTHPFALMREWLASDYAHDAEYFGRLASALDAHARVVFREVPMERDIHG